MRILFQSRESLLDSTGGDTIQILKTKEYLEKLGLSIDLEPKKNVRYDLIHFFNTTGKIDSIYAKCVKYKSLGYPIVISPIYWDTNYIWNYYKGYNLRSGFNMYYNHVLKLLDFKKIQSNLMKQADLLLPNSKIEKELIIEKFGLDSSKFHIVYNSVDNFFFNAKSDSFVDKYGLDDFILYSGRVEPRKNTHSLCAAIKNLDLKLVVIGKLTNDEGYNSFCKRVGGQNVKYLGFVEHEELASAYAAAKAHVLPSFYETPGLSSLEAAAAGCNIASTNIGSAPEYFDNLAYYCDPRDITSIEDAISNSFNAKKNMKLKKHVMNYSWENTAQETLRGYEMILDGS